MLKSLCAPNKVLMGKVKIQDIDFNNRYFNVGLFGDIDDPNTITKNLEKLYDYIDRKEGGNSFFKYGKAKRKILQYARQFAGSRKYIISKRQVSNLIQVHKKEDNSYYVKIPYTADYLFRAIFKILDYYKKDDLRDIPEEIVSMFGQLRRNCFYDLQSFSCKRLCESIDITNIQRQLNDDLNSETFTLGKIV